MRLWSAAAVVSEVAARMYAAVSGWSVVRRLRHSVAAVQAKIAEGAVVIIDNQPPPAAPDSPTSQERRRRATPAAAPAGGGDTGQQASAGAAQLRPTATAAAAAQPVAPDSAEPGTSHARPEGAASQPTASERRSCSSDMSLGTMPHSRSRSESSPLAGSSLASARRRQQGGSAAGGRQRRMLEVASRPAAQLATALSSSTACMCAALACATVMCTLACATVMCTLACATVMCTLWEALLLALILGGWH
jgi:hypothetical protein